MTQSTFESPVRESKFWFTSAAGIYTHSRDTCTDMDLAIWTSFAPRQFRFIPHVQHPNIYTTNLCDLAKQASPMNHRAWNASLLSLPTKTYVYSRALKRVWRGSFWRYCSARRLSQRAASEIRCRSVVHQHPSHLIALPRNIHASLAADYAILAPNPFIGSELWVSESKVVCDWSFIIIIWVQRRDRTIVGWRCTGKAVIYSTVIWTILQIINTHKNHITYHSTLYHIAPNQIRIFSTALIRTI